MNEELEKAAQAAELLQSDLKELWRKSNDTSVSAQLAFLYEDADQIRWKLEDLLQ